VTRLPACAVGLVGFLAVLALAAFALKAGAIAEDGVMLWAGAIAAGDGTMPIGRVLAAYPTVPFLATALLQAITPAGAPIPALLAAGLAGVLAGIWFRSLRRAGLTPLAAGAAALLLALHPAVLRAAVAGPAAMFLVLFLYALGAALYDLRARSGVPEVMAAGLALLGLAFAHPMGAALAVAATPFLILAVRPMLVANSAGNVVLALIFPAVFCAGAFVYTSWVFPGSGWSFFLAPSESLAAWSAELSPLLGESFDGTTVLNAALAVACALLLAAPLAPVALARVYRRRPLIAPAFVIAAAAVSAAALAVSARLFGEPAILIAAAPVLAALVLTRVPVVRERLAAAMVLLVLGWAGGVAALAVADPRGAALVRLALEGRGGDRQEVDALALGGATIGRDGILVDSDNTPAVVLGRGRARGLLAPSDEAFAFALLFARIDTPLVAVPSPDTRAGARDRLNKAFPLLFRRGAPGYRLVYANESWRLYARDETGGIRQ
jgi:membrane protein XagC